MKNIKQTTHPSHHRACHYDSHRHASQSTPTERGSVSGTATRQFHPLLLASPGSRTRGVAPGSDRKPGLAIVCRRDAHPRRIGDLLQLAAQSPCLAHLPTCKLAHLPTCKLAHLPTCTLAAYPDRLHRPAIRAITSGTTPPSSAIHPAAHTPACSRNQTAPGARRA